MDFKRQPYFLSIFLVVNLTINVSNFGIGLSEIVYITPSANTPCHNAETCLTLSQFAANNSWLRPNTAVILPPSGNHTLNVNMIISNTANFSMLSEGESRISIICQQNAHLIFVHINRVWVRGLQFVGCGNNTVESVKNLKVEDCTYQGQAGSGTAVILINTNAIIQKTHFVSNTLGIKLPFLDTNIY